MAQKKSPFETTDCGRCGGSGFYGPTCVQGGRCFGCGGSGWKLTKRGDAASNWLVQQQQIACEFLAVGDVLMVDHMAAPCVFVRQRAQIDAVDVDQDGQVRLHVTFIGRKLGEFTGMNITTSADRTERVLRSRERTDELIALALQYQATLTQQGKPRKVRAAKRAA